MRKRTAFTSPPSTRATVSRRPEGQSTTTRAPAPPVDNPALDRPRDERDRAVAARRRVARVVEEDDAEVGTLVLGLGHEAAVHVGVAARLVDQQAANIVGVFESVAPLVEDRAAEKRVDAAGDDAERLAGRVVVDRADTALRAGELRRALSRKAVTPSRKSSAAWPPPAAVLPARAARRASPSARCRRAASSCRLHASAPGRTGRRAPPPVREASRRRRPRSRAPSRASAAESFRFCDIHSNARGAPSSRAMK